MNSGNVFLILLDGLVFYLLASACFAGNGEKKTRHLFLTLGAFAFLEGLSHFFKILSLMIGEIIHVRNFLFLRDSCEILAVLCTIEFFLLVFQVRRSRNIAVIAAATLIFVIGGNLSLDYLGLNIPLYVLIFAGAILSGIGLWKLSTRKTAAERALYLRLAAVFMFFSGITCLAEYISMKIAPENITYLFGILRIFCTFAVAEIVWLGIRHTDFTNAPGRLAILLYPPVSFLVFLGISFFLPDFLKKTGIGIAGEASRKYAVMLARQIDTESLRQRSILQFFADHSDLLLKNDKGGSALQTLVPPGMLPDGATLFFLTPDGFCADTTNTEHTGRYLGSSFLHRSYFKNAFTLGIGHEFAEDLIYGTPSIFNSRCIMKKDGTPGGVLVFSEPLKNAFQQTGVDYFALVSPENVVLMKQKSGSPENTDASGMKKTEKIPAGYLYRDGIQYAEAFPLSAGENGWRVVVGMENALPDLMYAAGCAFILLFWFLIIMFPAFYVIQRRGRNELARSTAWRTAVFNSNSSGIMVVNADRKIVDINESLLHLFRCSYTDFQNYGLEFIHSNREKGRLFSIRAYSALEHSGAFEEHVQTVSPDGQPMYVFVSGRSLYPERLKSGKFSRDTVWTITDETPQIVLKNSLEKVHSRYTLLMANSAAHVFVVDSQGFFLESNDPEIAERIRRGEGQVHLSDFFGTTTTAFYANLVKNVFESGRTMKYTRAVKFKGVVSERSDTVYPIREKDSVAAVGIISYDGKKQQPLRSEKD